MRIFIKILLLPVKLVILILMLLLKIIYGIGWLVVHIGGRIAAPLMTFVLICGIWSAVQTNWFHVGLLAGIEALLFALFIGADVLLVLVLAMNDGLRKVLRA